MFTKKGEFIELSQNSIETLESVIPVVDASILDNFSKFASNLKKIAPKAEDFLYFSCVMLHAAEASLVNDDGSPKLTAKGEVATATWDKKGGSWRWKSNDPSIKPYANSNRDIFPEEELVKAYRKWVGKPLCIDHKSSSVDHVRGFIVDTVYDRKLKRVIGLCALDKKNYPDLARKVATGYSSCVSMGTAVSEAVCTDCGQVARVESEFCKCMRGRTCYGEINVGLNPIELSIVVNGADPKAHIKHIIAAAQNLNNYVEDKANALNKLATKFTANLSFGDQESIMVTSMDIESFQNDVKKAMSDYQALNEEADSVEAYAQTNSLEIIPETELGTTDFSLAPPAQRFASEDVQVVKLQLANIEGNITQMQKDLDKLAQNINISKQEEIMSGSRDNGLKDKKGYFQGAGGVNEPTPGQVKYPVDPMQDDLRESGDKHMTGPAPFPGVGNVEQMYPGVGEKDLEVKKMHARAAAEERAQKRAALVNKAKETLENRKIGYWQGGGGVNEPTPGKKKYPVDPAQDNLREDGDKHMVGQKPFPDVGKVDGLHPSPESADVSDELKRKQMLARAGLKARFMKASKADGSHDLGKSAWEVYMGDKLLLTASVDEITNGQSDKLYSGIATKEYGADLINKVKVQGADKVKSLFKAAQDPAPVAPPAEVPAMPEAPVEPAAEATPEAPVDSGEGDPKDTVIELADKVKDLSSDLSEAVKALTGEQSEMGDLDGLSVDDSAAEDGKVTVAKLQVMRKELNPALLQACKEAVANLNDHAHELTTIAKMYEKGGITAANKDYVSSLVEAAIVEAKEAFADSFSLLNGFVRYARGTQAIVKRAKQEAELNKVAQGDNMPEGLMAMVDEVHASDDEMNAEADSNVVDVESMLASDLDATDADDNDAVMVPTAAKAAEFAKANPTVPVEIKTADSKEARAAARAKLAAEMKWNPMLAEFHKHVDDGPALDVKPSGDLAKVETLEEVHDKMMDVATAPVKVRKEAEAIQRLIVEGKLNTSDLPQLVANGLDGDAVKYWKQFYGQIGSEGSQFANELVKEHSKAQLEEQMSIYRVKLARAYELTYDMVDRGLISHDKSSINDQVDQVMKWNDEGFESMKRVIAKQSVSNVKTAGRIPQIGINNSGDESVSNDDMATLLASAFAKSSKKLF